MNDITLLWVAICVFILLIIGLALTVYEFKTYIIEPEDKRKKTDKDN
jgi:hypothetical protein